ncbi:MAG: hemerythrin family protein [Pseudomonadota bacterium]
MAIEWRNEMSVGNTTVDNDHRYLIGLINSFERSMDTFENTANLLVALRQLEEYARQHFDREEKFQESIKYPGLAKHRESHGMLVSQLKDLTAAVTSRDSLEKGGMNKQQFIEFLRHWLIDHVIKEDLLFKPYIKRS